MNTPTTSALAPEMLRMQARAAHLYVKGDDQAIAKAYGDPVTARRLAACWNACLGMPTSVLEDLGHVDRGGVQRLVDVAYAARLAAAGYAIADVDGKRWRTMDTLGMPTWTDDPKRALVTRLREHIELYAQDDPEDVRIVPAPEVAS